MIDKMKFNFVMFKITNLLYFILFGLMIYSLAFKFGILVGIFREKGIDIDSLGLYPFATIFAFSFVYVFSFMVLDEMEYTYKKELESYIFEEIDYIWGIKCKNGLNLN